MKQLQILLYFTLILAFAILVGISGSSHKMTAFDRTVKEFDYSKYWKQIDSLERLGLPGSAITIVEKVYENARSEENEDQIIKSLIFKMKFEHTFQPNYFATRILELEEEVDKYEYSIQSILHSMLGDMYWQYFRNNRYRYYNRSQTIKYDSDDIETWDLDKILGKAREHYLVSVAQPERLKTVILEDNYNAILLKGERDAVRRPTLLDLLANRAIDFFKSTESSINKPISSFSLNKKEYFAPDIEFTKLNLETFDTTDHQYQVLKLYQLLIASNLKNVPNEALLDADINRLEFLKNHSSLSLKNKYYQQALENMLHSYSGNESLQAEIKYYLAKAITERANDDKTESTDDCKDNFIEAISLCNEVLSKKDLPHFIITNCLALIQQINQKSLQTEVEKVILPQEHFPVSISYRNLDSVYICIYKTYVSEVIGFMRKKNRNSVHGYFGYPKFYIDTFKTKVPIVELAIDLPDAEDYRKHSTEIILPPLPIGQYAILVSTNRNFTYDTNAVSLDFLTSSSLSYIHRGSYEKQQEYYVFDRKSGKPLNNVQARFRTYEYHYGKRKDIIKFYANLRSNEEGYFKITQKNSKRLLMELIYKSDTLRNTDILSPYNAPYNNYYRKQPDYTYNRIHIFTDRAIYRPGQTIYFKGISYTTDQKKKHEIQRNYTSQVRLLDVNHQEIEEIEFTTNEYGTFSGSFTLPQGLLNGRMQITTPNGSKFIQVEEYKRPKFEVSFKDTKGSFKLEEEVKATGSAMTFSGAPLENADVKYRVVRKTTFPYWYWWFDPTPDQEIANGTSTTAKNGEFEIIFTAVPDYGESKQSNPVFNYTITADVTDINGETHSTTKTIKVGYTALMAGTNIPEILDKKENSKFRISTTNIEGNFEGALGTITIHKLTGPEATYKSRLWKAPDKFLYSKEEFHALLPDYPYADELNVSEWPREKILFEQKFDTELSQEFVLKNLKNWPAGKYITEIITADKYGQEVKSVSYFTLYEDQNKKMPFHEEDLFHLFDKKAEPGGKAQLLIGSSSDSIKVLYELEQDGALIEKKWISLDMEMKLLRIPIKEEYRGNVHLNLVYIKNGRIYNHNETIRVPYTNKKLDISFETFRNKLQPGEQEEWKLKLSGSEGEKVAAEMVATLYDASLDEFMNNEFNLSPERYFSPRLKWSADKGYSTSTGQLVTYYWNPDFGYTYLSHNQLNWFGYNMNYYPMIVNYNQVKGLEHGSIVVVSNKDANSVLVTGTVKSTAGEALPGVNVLISGTTVGTVTDIDGNFKLDYSGKEANLLFSFVGFLTETITVSGKTELAVELMEDIQKLEEVVVVGYGTTKTSHLTAAIANSAGGMEIVALADEEEVAEVHYSMNAAADAIYGSRSLVPISLSFKKGEAVQQSLASVQTRKNFNETAFFYPHLQTNAQGEIIINFTVPESLTRWKMLGYAHTQDFKHGRTQNQLVTSKNLMVVPNMPRFFREKDTITLSSKIINLADSAISGFAQLMLFDASTMEPIDDGLQNIQAIKSFEIDSASSISASWTISIPNDLDAVMYRFVASSGKFTDGEEMSIPVLPNRMLVTETMPVWVKGNETREFTLDKLQNNSSATLTHHSLSFEFTANPAWYAIQALPYMMNYPYDCMEQTFAKFYANSIASHIVNSNPSIRKVFETWQGEEDSETFLSKLEKNQELKQLMLEETPWVLDAKNETERKKRVALLFDLRRMSNELERALDKLAKGQNSSGAWPWFKGGPENRYITQHIVTGLGHLSQLGIKDVRDNKKVWHMITRAISYLDRQAARDLNDLKKHYTEEELKQDYLYHNQVHYLYCRSFFKDIPLSGESQEVIKYYKRQAERYWLNENYYSQALIALTFHRDGETKVPERILKSLRQRSTISEEMGMYWDQKWGYYWYQMPVETQSIMIEAFTEIARDTAAVDQMKLWLLKNKQTADWKTTKATAEACYALLLQGTSWLSQEIDIDIKVGEITVDPAIMPEIKVEAGTGYFKKTWQKDEISPEMAVVKLTKMEPGVSWGGLYWQYFEDLNKITPSETPLKLEKELFVEKMTDRGAVIEPIDKSDPIKVGDKIIVRIILRVDREMEYLHMKDMRAAAFEPINVISQGKYQDGLWYYETTKDASTNFFFDYVRKGTYVFEYPLRVTHGGTFSNGITTIQCMYAPEFTSHSEGIQVRIIE